MTEEEETAEESKKEGKQLTASEKLERSRKEDLHDEGAIRLLNAQHMVNRESKKDDENYDHGAEVNDSLVKITKGIEVHMDIQLTVVREKMKAGYLKARSEGKNERDANIISANIAVETLQELFDNMGWVNGQTDHFQLVINEQLSGGVIKKGARTVKKLVLYIPEKAAGAVAKGIKVATFGVVNLGKEKKVK